VLLGVRRDLSAMLRVLRRIDRKAADTTAIAYGLRETEANQSRI
jgi:hypothetical protein